MKLTNEEKLIVEQNLKGSGICPNCKSTNGVDIFTAKFRLMSPLVINNVIDPMKMDAIPVIATSCVDCGFISLFNAETLGIDKASD